MPSLEQFNLPIPTDSKEFEKIVRDYFSYLYGVEFSIYGRNGQSQNGIDVVGRYGDEFIGVQCKLYQGTIKDSLIEEEIRKADNFTPKLSKFYIATTAPVDANIQSYIYKKREAFKCDIVYWDVIQSFLKTNNNILIKYYPPQFINTNTELIKFEEYFGEIIKEAIETDFAAAPFSIHYVDMLEEKINSWISSCNSFSNNDMEKCSQEILENLLSIKSYICNPVYYHVISNEYLIFNNRSIEEGERLRNELQPNILKLRQNIYYLYKKLKLHK